MPIMHSESVTIVFAGAALSGMPPAQEQASLIGQVVRVVERPGEADQRFILEVTNQPDRPLTDQEGDRLMALCSRITVSAPWAGQMGFDGATSALRLVGAMSELSFTWWGKVPPEWSEAGALFDYVMELVRAQANHQASG